VSEPATLLRADRVSVSRGARQVVHEVSLELRAGEVVALLGPNGAGKSTLLDALAGALVPAAGTIERRGRIGIALQSPDLARRTALANVTAALAWWGVPRAQRESRARAALALMGAEGLVGRQAASLSGGERRRVHLARTIAVRPDVLLLDEPFAGLDAGTRATMLDDTGAALREAAGAALVVVHDRAEAWALADRLLILLDGRLAAEGAPRELLERPPTTEVARFLGFDGGVMEPDGTLTLTRPHHVVLDPNGPITARVERVIPIEDGVRLELQLPGGRLFTVAPIPGPVKGDTVAVRLTGGVSFDQPPGEVPAEVAQSRRP
jgi:ATPase subunit of ABC transporter with duplicated ATPase domains